MRAPRQIVRILTVVGTLVAAACTDLHPVSPGGGGADELSVERRPTPAPTLSETRNSAPPISSLCAPPTTFQLWVGDGFPATVQIGNDAKNLYVTYTATGPQEDGWFVSDVRIAVSKSLQTIPRDSEGRADPWSFPYAATLTPVLRSYTYTIPLSDVPAYAGDQLVVAAWAGMVHPVTSDWDGDWEWVTGWAIWNIFSGRLQDLSNYTVTRCPDSPPPPPKAQGIITITFDDGWLETYTRAFPILRDLGLRANSSVWPVAIDQEYDGFMTVDQLHELQDAGWNIVSHSMTHPYLTKVSDAQLDYELRESQAWIQKNGFGDGHFFVVPYHDWGQRERDAIKKYYRGARGTSAIQYNPPMLVKVPIQDPYALTSFEPEFAPYTTAEGREITRQYLDRAVAEGAYIDILFHHIPAENLDAFRQMMEIIAEYKPYIKTYNEVIP